MKGFFRKELWPISKKFEGGSFEIGDDVEDTQFITQKTAGGGGGKNKSGGGDALRDDLSGSKRSGCRKRPGWIILSGTGEGVSKKRGGVVASLPPDTGGSVGVMGHFGGGCSIKVVKKRLAFLENGRERTACRRLSSVPEAGKKN